MDYLFDICTVSDFVKGEKGTLLRLKSKSPSQIKIAAITAYEPWYGLSKDPQLKARTKNVILGFLSDIEITPFYEEEARCAADTRSKLEKGGKPIEAYDTLIAATALARGFVLVTSNEKEFSRVPNIEIENWRNQLG